MTSGRKRSLLTQSNQSDSTLSEQTPRYCKVFWDYHGRAAHGTANHFHHHLLEWLKRAENDRDPHDEHSVSYVALETGVTEYTPTHSAAYCVLPLPSGKHVYRVLKAHRAILVEPS